MEERADGRRGGGSKGRDQGRQGRAAEREEFPERCGGQVRGKDVVGSGGMDILSFEQWRRAATDDVLYLYKYIKFPVADHVT